MPVNGTSVAHVRKVVIPNYRQRRTRTDKIAREYGAMAVPAAIILCAAALVALIVSLA